MAKPFSHDEYARRQERLLSEMADAKLDALLLFSQESMYWLTGYETFGFCFFQCLVVKADGSTHLLTRVADLRQAHATSTIENIVLWRDYEGANPALDLRNLLNGLGLLGCRIGVEYRAHGLNGADCRRLDEQLLSFAKIVDISGLIDRLRLVKSPEEIAMIRKAAQLSDDVFAAALPKIAPGVGEADILAAMMSANLKSDGDFPANEYVIGSGSDALLCRYKSGRRILSSQDQLTLEWSGVYRHYHAPMMRTVLIGEPSARHLVLYEAAREAIETLATAMRPGVVFADLFAVYTQIMERRDLTRHRLHGCGYSIGARFAPTWMEDQHFEAESDYQIKPNMAFFAHAMLFDSEESAAMTLGASYLVLEEETQALSRHPLDMIIK